MELFPEFVEQIKGLLKLKKDSKQVYCDSLIFNVEEKLLILRRTPTDDFEPNKWSLPGGKLEEGETVYEGTLRELVEETNILVNPFTSSNCYLTQYTNSDGSTSHYSIFSIKGETNIILDVTEHSEWKWISVSELPEYDFLFDLGSRISEILKEHTFISTDYVSTLEPESPFEIEDANHFLDTLVNEGVIDDERFLMLKAQLNTFQGDPSHGGKLVAIKKVDKNGHLVTEWVTREEAEQRKGKETQENKKTSAKESFSPQKLAHFARTTSEESLRNTISKSPDPKLRSIAHKEIDRRERVEKITPKKETKTK